MNLAFTNVIKQCDDGKPRERDYKRVGTLAVHRIGKTLGEDAITICRRFIDDPEVARYTGGHVPYTFIIGEDGTIWQCLPVTDVGMHARRWNISALGIACIGDFRKHDMPGVQFAQLVKLCVALQFGFSYKLAVKGHDELPGGSSDPDKRCPGDRVDMADVRWAIESYAGEDRLKEMGIEL